MTSRNRELLKSILLLFGSFAFGYNASTVLHELGHAIGYWIIGGTVEGLIIHPFSWSYCIGGSISEYPNFTTWAGVLFGMVMGLLLVAVVWRWRGPYVMLVFMTGVVACLHNGFYLIFGCLAKSPGDPRSLIFSGTPMAVVIAVGLLMFSVGFILAGVCLRLIGIRSSDGVKSRILVLGGGLLPYLVAIFVYQWRYNAEELRMWVAKGVSIIILLLFFAILWAITERRLRWLRDAKAKKVTWPGVVLANLCAFVLLLLLCILFVWYEVKMHTRYKLTYYDRQSNLAGTTLKVVDDPNEYYRVYHHKPECSVFWNWHGRKGKAKIPDLAKCATICPDSNEVVVPAIRGVLLVPMDGRPYRWAFKEDGLFLHSKWAVSRDGRKVLVYGYDSKAIEDVLIALDISNGRKTRFEIPESPWEIIFIEETTAVASVRENLIKVEFTESGDHRFSVEPGAGKKGEVKGLYKGEYVFHSPTFWTEENADQHVIEYGDMKVPFTDPVSFVSASKSYIWAVDINGQVYRVNPDGSKVHVGKYAPNEMIGRGVLRDSLWLAFSDGTVRVFGDSAAVAKITLP